LFRDAKAGLPAGGKEPERGHCLSAPAVGRSHPKKAEGVVWQIKGTCLRDDLCAQHI
jgi:hypothetical protein